MKTASGASRSAILYFGMTCVTMFLAEAAKFNCGELGVRKGFMSSGIMDGRIRSIVRKCLSIIIVVYVRYIYI